MIKWIFGKYLFIQNLDGSFALEQVNNSAGESNEHEELSEAKTTFTNSHIRKIYGKTPVLEPLFE